MTGSDLKAFKLKYKLLTSDLAALLDVGETYVTKMERGIVPIRRHVHTLILALTRLSDKNRAEILAEARDHYVIRLTKETTYD